MGNDADISFAAYKFVCGENSQICRLCFASLSGKKLSIQDSAFIERRYMTENITFHDMLDSLDVPTDDSLPLNLCSECAITITHSYTFKKLSQYSNEAWNRALVQLEETLDEIQFINDTMKTAFLTINQNHEKVIYVTTKKISSQSKLEALSKFKSLMKRKKYIRQKKDRNKAINKAIICDHCGEQSSGKMALRNHMRKHKHKNYQCPECCKTFLTKRTLQTHVERSHYPKKLQCHQCSKMFSTMRFLKEHERSDHFTRTCKVCTAQFPTLNALRLHKDTHELLKCPQCNKIFKKKTNLRDHIKICGVESEISVFCDICNKGYVRKGSLRSHLKIVHGFGKILKCSFCDKKFDTISTLNMHMVKHTRERNFCCEKCGGKFVTKAALVYHTRIHTGERPFPCDLCDEKFLSTSRRMEHKRRKHFAPTEECTICHSKFASKKELEKHFIRHSNPQSKLFVPLSETHAANNLFKVQFSSVNKEQMFYIENS